MAIRTASEEERRYRAVQAQRQQEWAAFDSLPKPVRVALTKSTQLYSTPQVLAYYRQACAYMGHEVALRSTVGMIAELERQNELEFTSRLTKALRGAI